MAQQIIQDLADGIRNNPAHPDERMHEPGAVRADGHAKAGADRLRDNLP